MKCKCVFDIKKINFNVIVISGLLGIIFVCLCF